MRKNGWPRTAGSASVQRTRGAGTAGQWARPSSTRASRSTSASRKIWLVVVCIRSTSASVVPSHSAVSGTVTLELPLVGVPCSATRTGSRDAAPSAARRRATHSASARSTAAGSSRATAMSGAVRGPGAERVDDAGEGVDRAPVQEDAVGTGGQVVAQPRGTRGRGAGRRRPRSASGPAGCGSPRPGRRPAPASRRRSRGRRTAGAHARRRARRRPSRSPRPARRRGPASAGSRDPRAPTISSVSASSRSAATTTVACTAIVSGSRPAVAAASRTRPTDRATASGVRSGWSTTASNARPPSASVSGPTAARRSGGGGSSIVSSELERRPLARRARVGDPLARPQPAQHRRGVLDHAGRRDRETVRVPAPRRAASEAEDEAAAGEHLERLAHRRERHGVARPDVRDRPRRGGPATWSGSARRRATAGPWCRSARRRTPCRAPAARRRWPGRSPGAGRARRRGARSTRAGTACRGRQPWWCSRRDRTLSGVAAYVIVDVDSTDEARAARYRERSGPSVARHGGHFVVRGGGDLRLRRHLGTPSARRDRVPERGRGTRLVRVR